MAVVFQQPQLPIWFDHIESASIATANYDPIVTLAGLKTLGHFTSNGFGLKNGTETAAFIRAITLAQYRMNRNSCTGVVPTTIHLNGGDWCLTPLIKVFAANDGTYPSTGMTTVDIGWIL